jgi:hypothetical protein
VSGAGDPSIQGFATDISVNRGETIDFKIDTTAAAYDLEIYRLGYYGGDGARLVETIEDVQGGPGGLHARGHRDGRRCHHERQAPRLRQLVGLGELGRSRRRDLRRLHRAADPHDDGGASHIPFIVRDDAAPPICSSRPPTRPGSPTTPTAATTPTAVPARRWRRSSATTARSRFAAPSSRTTCSTPSTRCCAGSSATATTSATSLAIDTERHAARLLNHEVFLSVGHDEYWSQGRRAAVTAARDAGVHLAFFSANEIYWKTRWEPSTADGGSTDYRTQVVYKAGSSAPSGPAEHRNCFQNYSCDPSGIWTGQWRESESGMPPENSLSGQISWRLNEVPMTVPGEYAPMRFWRDTDVADLAPGGRSRSPRAPSGTSGTPSTRSSPTSTRRVASCCPRRASRRSLGPRSTT